MPLGRSIPVDDDEDEEERRHPFVRVALVLFCLLVLAVVGAAAVSYTHLTLPTTERV